MDAMMYETMRLCDECAREVSRELPDKDLRREWPVIACDRCGTREGGRYVWRIEPRFTPPQQGVRRDR